MWEKAESCGQEEDTGSLKQAVLPVNQAGTSLGVFRCPVDSVGLAFTAGEECILILADRLPYHVL